MPSVLGLAGRQDSLDSSCICNGHFLAFLQTDKGGELTHALLLVTAACFPSLVEAHDGLAQFCPETEF